MRISDWSSDVCSSDLLARNARTAERLGNAFRGRDARKVYWAITVGVPNPRQGKIDLPLGKIGGRGGEKVAPDPEGGRSAITLYSVLEAAGKRLAWVALWPRTGRTHQLRAQDRKSTRLNSSH